MVDKETQLEIDHLRFLANSLNEKRKNKTLTDVTIICNGISYFAHKFILSASCTFFSDLFDKKPLQSSIELNEFKPDILDVLLHFIYTGNLKITDETEVAEILAFAQRLHLDLLVRHCMQLIFEKLDNNNIVEFIQKAETSESTEMKEAVVEHIAANFKHFSQLPVFLELSEAFISSIFSHKHLNCTEDEKFERALVWIGHDEAARSDNIAFLLNGTDFTQLTTDYLSNLIIDNPIVLSNRLLRQQISKEVLRFRTKEENKSVQNFSSSPYESNNTHKDRSNSNIDLELNQSDPCQSKSQKQYPNSDSCLDFGSQPKAVNGRSVMPLSYETNIKTVEKLSNEFIIAISTEKGKVCLVYHIPEEKNQISFNATEFSLEEEKLLLPVRSAVCAVDEIIYFLGGRTEDTWMAQSTTLTYDVRKEKWQKKSNMNTHRYSAACCAYKDHIYVFGGLDQNNVRIGTLECYNIPSNTWKILGQSLSNRENPSLCALNECLYVIGGYAVARDQCNKQMKHSTVASGEKYDIATNQWTKFTTKLPVGHLSEEKEYRVAVINTKIYAIKSQPSCHDKELRILYEYCSTSKAWKDRSFHVDLKSVVFIGKYKNDICIIDNTGKVILYSLKECKILHSDKINISNKPILYASRIKL